MAGKRICLLSITALLCACNAIGPAGFNPSEPTVGNVAAISKPSTYIHSIRFAHHLAGVSLTINGNGFGPKPTPPPSPDPNCIPTRSTAHDTAYFRIGDLNNFSEAGYLCNSDSVRYGKWTKTTIHISKYAAATPGDAIIVGVWNLNTDKGAAWGGNVPPVTSGTPAISSVRITGSGARLHVVIKGNNFGNAPPHVRTRLAAGPYVGDTAFLLVNDLAYHTFSDAKPRTPGKVSINFEAGFARKDYGRNQITVVYKMWNPTEIVLGGFGGQYARSHMPVRHGDPIAIAIFNTSNSHLATAWAGFVP